ncbi:MAG: glucose-phosphate thymidylyltransferase [Eubacterium sp.]|nr:glucose-phosphate thymidylyltransferase [Eubacterium sp.]
MKALILSGGTGTRLRPLTYTNAKQLLPLANKPILFHIIEKVIEAGINKIGIIVGETSEAVKTAVGDGDRWNAEITYIYQPDPLGLAHAVKIAQDFIGEEDFIMVLGDNVFNMSLNSLIENFHINNADSAIMLYKVENPSQYGVAVVENNRLVRLVEKPKKFISDLIITGVYIFNSSIFAAIENTEPSARGELEITDAIQELLSTGGNVTYEIIQGWWKDTGKLQDMLDANQLILDEIITDNQIEQKDDTVYTGKLMISKSAVIKNSTIAGPTAIDDTAVIIDSYIGPYTSIGKGVEIINCEIDNCIILENTKLEGINKRINYSLIGKNVSIKAADKRPNANSFLVGDSSELYL